MDKETLEQWRKEWREIDAAVIKSARNSLALFLSENGEEVSDDSRQEEGG